MEVNKRGKQNFMSNTKNKKIIIILILLTTILLLSLNTVNAENNTSNDTTNDTNATNNTNNPPTTSTSSSSNAGIYVQTSGFSSLNLAKLKNAGIKHIFLYDGIFSKYSKTTITNFIKNAHNYNIKVHIIVKCFYDTSKGKWLSPSSSTYQNAAINKVKTYIKNYDFDGVHLDYVRYPGTAYKYSNGAGVITNFVKKVRSTINSIDSSVILSLALMPDEVINTGYYYGQNYKSLAAYADILCPMIYEYSYGQSNSWITSKTKSMIKLIAGSGAELWPVLQTYKGSSAISYTALCNDISSAVSGGAKNYVLFRYGLITSSFYTYGYNKQIPGTPASIKADVYITKITKYGNYYLKVTIKNNGNAASGTTKLKIWYSSKRYKIVTVPSIASKASKTVKVYFYRYSYHKKYKKYAMVNYNKYRSESSYSNNKVAFYTSYYRYKANLKIVKRSYSGRYFYYTVKNSGSATSKATTLRMRFYKNHRWYSKSVYVKALKVGASTKVRIYWYKYSSYRGRYLYATVNPYKKVLESSYSNTIKFKR